MKILKFVLDEYSKVDTSASKSQFLIGLHKIEGKKEEKAERLTFYVLDQLGFLMRVVSKPLPIQVGLVGHQQKDSCLGMCISSTTMVCSLYMGGWGKWLTFIILLEINVGRFASSSYFVLCRLQEP